MATRSALPAKPFTLRPCSGFAELDACVELQEQVWGYDERDIIPRRLFTVAQRIGGQVFGAFADSGDEKKSTGESMVGFAMALPAFREGVLYLHSHMLAVRPEWRNAGIGRALKLIQREDALARNIHKIEWTFDPLEIKNAYLNIHRLGVIVRSYTPDFYGPSTSPLQAGLQTDRMHAEWLLDSGRVVATLSGNPPPMSGIRQTIVVPSAMPEWKTSPSSVHKAAEVQASNRNLFLEAFQNGLAVVGFTRDAQGNGIYHLAEPPAVAQTSK
jgi:predicted GNAT superfamily acetyltransferase